MDIDLMWASYTKYRVMLEEMYTQWVQQPPPSDEGERLERPDIGDPGGPTLPDPDKDEATPKAPLQRAGPPTPTRRR
jgi:hypothetical protein